MENNNLNITDISSDFNSLTHQINTQAYKIFIEIHFFHHNSLPNNFNINDLSSIFYSKSNIKGDIKQISWEHTRQGLEWYLRFCGKDKGMHLNGETYNLVFEEEWKERTSIFWKIIKSKIQLPPLECLSFEPKINTDLFSRLPWRCCFILLNQNEGMVIYAGTKNKPIH